jgi:amino acid transporter
MTQTDATAPPGRIAESLARGKLGTPGVSFFMVAALGPLLVCAGTLPTAYAATGLTAVPAAFALTALVLAVFAVGYLAMARRLPNTGAFYILITKGLGRPAGVAGALVALVGYCAMQISLYGLIGVQLAGYLGDNLPWHPHWSWWSCALAVWALVAGLGMVKVELSSRILGALSILEIAVIILLAVKGLTHPAGGQLHLGSLNPARITWRGLGPLAAICVLCFLGFEQAPVYAVQAKSPRITLLRATVVCIGLGTVIYIGGALAMGGYYGSNTVATAQAQGASMFFAMSRGVLSGAGDTLFLTSLLAAALAYHNTLIRYAYSLGRDRVLPEALAKVGRSGIPRTASALQSAIGLAAIGATCAFGWDPVLQLFYIASSFGGFVIMALLAVTAFAIVAFFVRDPRGEHVVVRLCLPVAAALALTGMVWACVANFPTLLGITASDPTVGRLFLLLGCAVVVGVGWALTLKFRRPDVYAGLAPIVTEDAR